ncbi:MAG TPA: YCF48-related protein [Ignavibacteriaceae bacterium]|nr:YCF48-related protein [Ignavibacteriaceae bacterium]
MKTTVLSLMLLLLSLNSFSFAQQWSWVNPYPTGEQINQSYFLDEQKGFAIGNAGTLARTTDGGATWDLLETSINGNFIKITFNDDLNGWILGTSIDPYYNQTPYFLRTIDGGITWVQHTITSFNVYFSDMFFLNNNIGWVVGNEGKIFKTTDGGVSWIDKSPQQMYSTYFRSIVFRNENEGIISGYTDYESKFIIGYSTNGGNSWNLKYSPIALGGVEFETNIALDSIFITTSRSGLILRSSDKCYTWSFCMDTPIDELYCADFLNNGLGIAGSDSGAFLISTNAGASWAKKNTGYQAWLNSVQCATENFFTASGHGGTYSSTFPYILTSTDAGTTWNNHTRLLPNPINIYGIDIINDQTAFICGSYDYSNHYIYKTVDAGMSWQQVYNSSSSNINDIKLFDNLTIFACGQSNSYQGFILKSTDGGQNWTPQTLSSAYSINGLSLPGSEGIYAYSSELVLKSTNMGQSWYAVYQPSYPNFRDMEFITSDIGFVVGGYYPSSIYKTTNGGTSWSSYTIASNSEVIAISFPTQNVGYACGWSNIYKTIDGGMSWTQLNISNVYSLTDIVFNDELNGWIIGNNGIYRTTNGGQSWTLEFSKSEYSVNTFALKPLESLWAAGEGCKIIRYNGDLTTSVSDQNSSLPTQFALLQNYPNPFNPITKIRYDIPTASQVTLKIYDVLGEEVITLVNEFAQPGRYTVDWNAGSFASGVYLYTIQASDFIQTKKMILLK